MKILYLLILLFSSLNFHAQEKCVPPICIKTNLLSYAFKSYNLGLEVPLDSLHSATFLIYRKRIFAGQIYNDVLNWESTNFYFGNGIEARFGFKVKLKGEKKSYSKFYFEPQIQIGKVNSTYDWYTNDTPPLQIIEKFKANDIKFNLLLGNELRLSKRFFIETFVGFGAYKSNLRSNGWDEKLTGFNANLGLSLMYGL